MTEAFNGLALGTATNLIKGYAPGGTHPGACWTYCTAPAAADGAASA